MIEPQVWTTRLERLGFAVQRHLAGVIAGADCDLAIPVAHEGGDTVFAIDRHVEPVIVAEIDAWPADCKPLLLVAEGFGPDGRRRFGSLEEPVRYRLLVDPIDGSRGLMYDKRSAWFLAAVAPDSGEQTRLADTFAAVMVELPTSKQVWCDSFVASRGAPTTGRRCRVGGDDARPLAIRSSTATTLQFGFAHVVNFFPGIKVLAAELMEHIALNTLGKVEPGQGLIFDDQYICTGGQMVELLTGHDRFCCDLRPLFFDLLAKGSGHAVHGLECHPYDVAGALVALQAGVVISDGFGQPLDCPLDVHTGVHWCGYANPAIARHVQPIIRQWLQEHGIRGQSA